MSWIVTSCYTNATCFSSCPGVSFLRSLPPAMSWFLCLWIAVSCLVLCQATLYETIQQHHVPRPGRNAIQILGESCPKLFCSSPGWRRRPKCSRRLCFSVCGLYGLSRRACAVLCLSASPLSASAAWFEDVFKRTLFCFLGRWRVTVARWRLWLGIGHAQSSRFALPGLLLALRMFFKITMHHEKPGNSSSRCPVMENTWEIRKWILPTGNSSD